MALKLQHYTKFLFVRDPFVRLISAFRNKFGRCVSVCVCVCVCVCDGAGVVVFELRGKRRGLHLRFNRTPMCVFAFDFFVLLRPNEDFYKQFGSVMLRRYGNVSGGLPETAAEAFAAGVKPSFQQFVAYLLDPETETESVFNEHWRQVFASRRWESLREIKTTARREV